MQDLAQLERALEAAADLGTVVRTLKTMAAASVARFEHAAAVAEQHMDVLEAGLSVIFRDRPAPPESTETSPAWGLVALGSDLGLCGGFNDAVAETARRFIESDAPPSRLLVMGERLAGRLAEGGSRPDRLVRTPSTVETAERAVNAIVLAVDAWRRAGVPRAAVVGHRGVGFAYSVHSDRIWPPGRARLARRVYRPWPTRCIPEVVGPRGDVLEQHLRLYAEARVNRAVLQSVAAEYEARLAAMRAAERNIEERSDALRAAWRHVRQDTITLELLDIVGGWIASQTPGRRLGVDGDTPPTHRGGSRSR